MQERRTEHKAKIPTFYFYNIMSLAIIVLDLYSSLSLLFLYHVQDTGKSQHRGGEHDVNMRV